MTREELLSRLAGGPWCSPSARGLKLVRFATINFDGNVRPRTPAAAWSVDTRRSSTGCSVSQRSDSRAAWPGFPLGLRLRGGGQRALRESSQADMAKQLLRGPDAGPWSDLAERVSRVLRLPAAYAIRALLTTLCFDAREKWTAYARQQ